MGKNDVHRIPSKGSNRSKGSKAGSDYAGSKMSDEDWKDVLKVLHEQGEEVQEHHKHVEEAVQGKILEDQGRSKKANIFDDSYWAERWEEAEQNPYSRKWFECKANNIMGQVKFDMGVGVVIMMNSATIGMESEITTADPDGLPGFFTILEWFYMVVYTVELSLRFFTYGLKCLVNPWVRFDLFLVGIGWLTEILKIAMEGNKDMEDKLGMVMVLRLLRLLRLARALRLFSQFKVLWQLVRGLLSSLSTMASMTLLMCLILYLYAVMALELITKYQIPDGESYKADFDSLVAGNFGSLFNCIMTLLAGVTDGFASTWVKLLVMEDLPSGAFLLFFFYFMSYIIIVIIAMMNLIMAVIVEGALASAEEDKDVARAYKAKQLEAVTPKIRKMFLELDADGSGELDLEEVMNAPDELRDELGKFVETESLKELFEMIDADGGGSIDVEEFVDGITQIVASDEPMENIRSRKQMQCARMQLTKIEEELPEMEKRIMESIEKMMDEKLAKIIESLAASNAKSPGRRPPSRDRDDTSPRLSPNGRSPKSGRSPGRSRKENFADTWAPKVELSYY